MNKFSSSLSLRAAARLQKSLTDSAADSNKNDVATQAAAEQDTSYRSPLGFKRVIENMFTSGGRGDRRKEQIKVVQNVLKVFKEALVTKDVFLKIQKLLLEEQNTSQGFFDGTNQFQFSIDNKKKINIIINNITLTFDKNVFEKLIDKFIMKASDHDIRNRYKNQIVPTIKSSINSNGATVTLDYNAPINKAGDIVATVCEKDKLDQIVTLNKELLITKIESQAPLLPVPIINTIGDFKKEAYGIIEKLLEKNQRNDGVFIVDSKIYICNSFTDGFKGNNIFHTILLVLKSLIKKDNIILLNHLDMMINRYCDIPIIGDIEPASFKDKLKVAVNSLVTDYQSKVKDLKISKPYVQAKYISINELDAMVPSDDEFISFKNIDKVQLQNIELLHLNLESAVNEAELLYDLADKIKHKQLKQNAINIINTCYDNGEFFATFRTTDNDNIQELVDTINAIIQRETTLQTCINNLKDNDKTIMEQIINTTYNDIPQEFVIDDINTAFVNCVQEYNKLQYNDLLKKYTTSNILTSYIKTYLKYTTEKYMESTDKETLIIPIKKINNDIKKIEKSKSTYLTNVKYIQDTYGNELLPIIQLLTIDDTASIDDLYTRQSNIIKLIIAFDILTYDFNIQIDKIPFNQPARIDKCYNIRQYIARIFKECNCFDDILKILDKLQDLIQSSTEEIKNFWQSKQYDNYNDVINLIQSVETGISKLSNKTSNEGYKHKAAHIVLNELAIDKLIDTLTDKSIQQQNIDFSNNSNSSNDSNDPETIIQDLLLQKYNNKSATAATQAKQLIVNNTQNDSYADLSSEDLQIISDAKNGIFNI